MWQRCAAESVGALTAETTPGPASVSVDAAVAIAADGSEIKESGRSKLNAADAVLEAAAVGDSRKAECECDAGDGRLMRI